MEFDKQGSYQHVCRYRVMEFCDTVMKKSWNFVAKISWQPCKCDRKHFLSNEPLLISQYIGKIQEKILKRNETLLRVSINL